MGVKAKAKIKADAAILNIQIKKENLFLGVPPKFKIIKVASLALVDPIINSIKQQILNLLGSLSLDMLISLGLGFLFAQLNKEKLNKEDLTNIKNPIGTDVTISDQDLLDAVKTNKDLAIINRFISKDFDNKMADELTEACAIEDFGNNIIKKLEKALNRKDFSGDNFINIIESNSGFENSTENINLNSVSDKNNPENSLRNLLDKFGNILAILLLLFSIFMLVREYIISNRYPSQFRGRILGNIIRTITGLIKKILKPIPNINIPKKPNIKEIKEESKNKLQKLLSSLKIIDAIIIALNAATLIYLNNRKKGQQISFNELSAVSSTEACNILLTAREITDQSNNNILTNISLDSSNLIPFSYEGFPCPVDITNIPIVPHMPFEEKLLDNFCDIDLEVLDSNINERTINNTAGNAIFENMSNQKFIKTVYKGYIIQPGQSIGNIGKDVIYAPIGGKVIKIDKNKIWLTDIIDVGFTKIQQESETLKSKYIKITNIKEFIREFYGIVQYPSIVSRAKDPISLNTIINDNEPIILYNQLITKVNNIKKTYEKNIKIIAGENNVKIQSKKENLNGLQKSINNQENLLFKNLKGVIKEANNEALEITAISGNYILMDWYFRLIADLQNFYNPKNTIIIDFQHKLNTLLLDRFFIEKHNITEVEALINKLFNLNTSSKKNYIIELNKIWRDNFGNEAIKAIRVYTERIIKKNTRGFSISKDEIKKYVARITSLYIFIKDAQNILKGRIEYIPKEDEIQRVSKEKKFIDNFFASLFKEINSINKEINNSIKKIKDMATSSVPPSIRNINEIDYEWYGLKGRGRTCPIPGVEDPYLSPHTINDYDQYKYWLKYCAIATLFSIIPSIAGRAKGFPTPPPGIPFPVIYIPFFGMMTKWGIFAVGLTITGIFPFPWLLFVNFSTDYNTPLGDPTAPVKNTIRKTKRSLSKKLKDYNQKTLDNYLNKSEQDITIENNKIEKTELDKQNHKINRPIRERSIDRVQNIQNTQQYNEKIIIWKKEQLDYSTDMSILRKKRYELERKNKIVKNARDGNNNALSKATDVKLISIKKSKETLDLALDQLDVLIDSTDLILKPLPITMKPDTSNFGSTLKNKKIILEMANDIDKQVQQPAINTILSKSEMKSNDFMNTGYSKIANESLNRGIMKKALKVGMPLMITNDPFPKYENLSISNLAWIPFLINSWGPAGAKSFGIPF